MDNLQATLEMMRRSVFVELSDEEIGQAFALGDGRCNAKEEDIRRHQSGYHKDNDRREYPHQIGLLG